jgi:hypothetical protein
MQPATEETSILSGGTRGDTSSTEQIAELSSDNPSREDFSVEEQKTWREAVSVLAKSKRIIVHLDEGDRKEVEEIAGQLKGALEAGKFDEVGQITSELNDVLFYLE